MALAQIRESFVCTPRDAATLGNLAGAVVVKKIGTTGTATVEELIAKLQARS